MSEVAGRLPRQHVSPAEAFAALRGPTGTLLVGFLLISALGAAKAVAVWTQGQFFDTDDAMRLVQLRDLLAGQGWRDLTQPRMGEAQGVAMHWSRVLDLPLVGLLALLKPLPGAEVAERAMRLAFPALLALLYLSALGALARRMTDSRGAFAATLIAVLAPATNIQFEPGRIDHHGAQIALLLAMAAAAMTALDPARARAGALAGVAAAASLAISVENLPFLAAAGAVFGVALLVDAAQGRAAAWFGAGLALAAPVSYAIFAIDPAGRACDAFSLFHLSAAILGGGALALAGLAAARGAPVAWRLALMGGTAAGLAWLAVTQFPACLGSPLAGVPEDVRRLWLDHVSEARPLTLLLSKRPDLGLPLGAPVAVGLFAALCLAWRAAGVARARWAALAALLAAGLAATIWQVRAASSALPLAAVAGAGVALAVADRLSRIERPLARLAPMLVAMPFASLFWMAVTPDLTRPDARPHGSAAACFSPAGLAALAQLPPGRVLSSIDAGSYILARTPHRVLAGAYHRNVAGNRAALAAFAAPPGEARDIVARAGVDIVAICPDLVDLSIYAESSPTGLAARLLARDIPDWLTPLPANGPLRLYRVRG